MPEYSKITLRSDRNATCMTPTSIAATCPVCRRPGTLNPINGAGHDIKLRDGIVVGYRVCSNPMCGNFILGVWHSSCLVDIYPSQPIEVDKTNIPDQVWSCFDEALKCFSEKCYRAAAMLVRHSLEEVCEEQGGKGKSLVDRIKALRTKVVLPNKLFDSMDELRLLGNDAAHIEARVYRDNGPDELTLAIALTKEILKELYQLQELLNQLQQLKAAHAQPTNI